MEWLPTGVFVRVLSHLTGGVASNDPEQGSRDHLLSYAAACRHLGEVAVVEAVGIAGYYSLVALTLGAFGVGEEDG